MACPGAAEVGRFRVAAVRWHDTEMTVAGTGYTGEAGVECAVPLSIAGEFWDALLDAGIMPAGLGARDTLRLEAGMNLYGQDMDRNVTPLESGLGWTVDLAAPRNFVGKDALAKQTVELDSAKARQALRLVEWLEDLDDVQRVTANFDIPEDVYAEVAG